MTQLLCAHFIEGQRRQACNNDAASIVRYEGGRAELLEIIPLSQIPGNTRSELLENALKVHTGQIARLT